VKRPKYQRMEFKAPAHPSGRPIPENRVVGRPMWRIPDKESNVPRLRDEKSTVAAIGFTARIVTDDDE
jgi:hypothetical protein